MHAIPARKTRLRRSGAYDTRSCERPLHVAMKEALGPFHIDAILNAMYAFARVFNLHLLSVHTRHTGQQNATSSKWCVRYVAEDTRP